MGSPPVSPLRGGRRRRQPTSTRASRGCSSRSVTAPSTMTAAPSATEPSRTSAVRPSGAKKLPTVSSSLMNVANARYSTMATPSFITDSPYTSPLNHGSTASERKTDSVATGSTALMMEPNARHSAHDMTGNVFSRASAYSPNPTTSVEMSVPTTANSRMLPTW
jgi:hypothetical protein